MKILSSDFRKGTVKVLITNPDDLWYLTQVIDQGDKVSGSTERKLKIGDSGTDRNVKVVRKKIFLEIKVEKTELNESLRILGTITQGPDDISFGSHHSFDLSDNDTITITKEKWLKFQIDKLKEASKAQGSRILIVVFDREEAYFALMKSIGVEHLTHISGEVQKKDQNNEVKSTFYAYLVETIEKYDQKHNYNKIICGSPAFFKEELAKNVQGDIKKKIIYSTCSSVDKRAFNEVLKRPEIIQALKDERITKELSVVDELLSEISKDDLASYGFKQVQNSLNQGAIKHLMITHKLIMDLREKNDYNKLDNLMKTADDMKAQITLIDSNNDAGKKLDGLGGIGALLRFKTH